MSFLSKFLDKTKIKIHQNFRKLLNNVKYSYSKHRKVYISTSAVLITLYTIYVVKVAKYNQKTSAVTLERSIQPMTSTTREIRFRKFASSIYNNQLFMNPDDFLHATMIGMTVNPRFERTRLSVIDLEAVKAVTPPVGENSSTFIQNLGKKGLISYSDYIFMLCILMLPNQTFEVIFRSLDINGDGFIRKNEYLLLADNLKNTIMPTEPQTNDEENFNIYHYLEGDSPVDTTLLVHFFGPDGTQHLFLEDFKRFMENLQEEIITLDFSTFAEGLSQAIPQVVFAEMLLRYTSMDLRSQQNYIQRVKDNIKEPKGITFEEFFNFSQFLKHFSSFSMTLKMFLMYQPVTKTEFLRAIEISTGIVLSENVLNTIFALFDVNNDGDLDYIEFMHIIKNFALRGLKKRLPQNEYEKFKMCMRDQVRSISKS